jgi:hypothetical protein
MGRVRRYKKFKSCDPFAKKGIGSEVSKKARGYDEPPDIYEDKEAKRLAKDEKDWSNQHKREKLLERDAMRVLKQQAEQDAKKSDKVTIEGKREDESMFAFKARLRQETKNTLRDEKVSKSSTAIKRKLRLRERKLKRQGKLRKKSQDSDFPGWEEVSLILLCIAVSTCSYFGVYRIGSGNGGRRRFDGTTANSADILAPAQME